MKKILLLILITGLFSFGNSKNKIPTRKFTSVKISGPRYRLEGAFGILSSKENSSYMNNRFISNSISLLSEWKVQVNEKIDATFGPKVTLDFSFSIFKGLYTYKPNLNLGAEANFNYRIKEKMKVYGGVEIGTGVGISIENANIHKTILTTISKISVGVKINDKYNIGVYLGNNIKGMLGIEAGYTF
ncbi:hypothetical protein KX935_04850 [Streptobacillus moniliformis]|uniref:Outer membrane protein beta-barrel domain-containing protein n=1 Tax=Streptobacillus moniliformis (strain ATCC 14647 / DSM 12112 / NCTC 10651 / 9901) TaxID=519441 RepID=D1AVS5_STRM9|nr:hypothetical protein [Streptobacillus moniliformis]ACZ01835.1 hypothetical protein Smon_1394 [Streptobacillus moniliformis DSM 12112]AVL43172.1 hypothetical protein CEP89_04765 [Streptobacillus moniliformis]QXW65165.1 hypothetical protein KX935_04850 [Streptobacillus moniliformis]SQA12965.1 Uncharacterised protein [Streptobacillus moniliformis]